MQKSSAQRSLHIGANPECALQQYRDIFIRIPAATKIDLPGKIASKQPFTSLFEQCLLILSDSVAMMLIQKMGIYQKDFKEMHANLE